MVSCCTFKAFFPYNIFSRFYTDMYEIQAFLSGENLSLALVMIYHSDGKLGLGAIHKIWGLLACFTPQNSRRVSLRDHLEPSSHAHT
jgi:hypothetical protein